MLAFSLFAMYLKRLSDDKAAVCVGGRGGREGGKEGRREGGKEGRREGGKEGRREEGRLTMRRVARASMNFSSVLLIEIYIIELPKYRRGRG